MKKKVLQSHLIPLFLFYICSVWTITFSYPWPVQEFSQEHRITATLGEFREVYRFHRGIDIGQAIDTPVYPVVSGRVIGIVRDTINAQVVIEGGIPLRSYHYIHITPSSSLIVGQEVIAGETLLGRILDYPAGAHLHFEEGEGNFNPLRSVTDGGIDPSPT